MKNLRNIAVILSILVLMACEKVDFTRDAPLKNAPEWILQDQQLHSGSSENARSAGENADDNTGDDTTEPSGITDPNTDPDGDSRKGKSK